VAVTPNDGDPRTAAQPVASPAVRRLGGVPLQHLAVPGSALVLLAVLAWIVTVRQSRGMTTDPGTMGLALPVFLAMWTAMMAAMMFPSIATVATAIARSIAARSTGWRRAGLIGSFVSGYLLAWAAYGVLAFAGLTGAGRLIETSPEKAGWLGVAIFAAAGIYQLTPIKDVCLSHCRSPLAQLLYYGAYKGRLRDLRVGLHHGAYCVGCCWALMLVLVAVGVMNVAVMALIAVVIFIEKLWRRGPRFGRAVGVGLLVIAALIPSHPGLAPALHQKPGGMRMDMDMPM
jgi:predicted metal-binding membrane protein